MVGWGAGRTRYSPVGMLPETFQTKRGVAPLPLAVTTAMIASAMAASVAARPVMTSPAGGAARHDACFAYRVAAVRRRTGGCERAASGRALRRQDRRPALRQPRSPGAPFLPSASRISAAGSGRRDAHGEQ